jgi:hypothetical protein
MSTPDTIHLFINGQSVVTLNQETWAIEIQVETSSAFAKAMLGDPEKLTLDEP